MSLELGTTVYIPITPSQQNVETRQKQPDHGCFIVEATTSDRSNFPDNHILCGKNRRLDVLGGYCATYEKARQLIHHSGELPDGGSISLLNEIKPGTPIPLTNEVQMA